MSVGLLIALTLSATIEVDAPVGCVADIEVEVALDEIGGIDPAEQVSVRVTPRQDIAPNAATADPELPTNNGYLLAVDIALLQAPSLHREVPLWPTECRDVADLVAVLVQQQRRAGLEQRLVRPGIPPERSDPPSTAKDSATQGRASTPTPPLDPRTRRPPELLEDRWGPCDGPARCGGWRASAGFGAAVGLGQRAAAEIGFDIDAATVVLQTSVVGALGDATGGELRSDVSVGAAWRTKLLQHVEVSTRGLVGVGGTTGGVRPAANSVAPCAVDEDGAPVIGEPDQHVTTATWFVAPAVGVRARYGYVFLEAGAFWHLRIDAAPVTYVAIGVTPLGG